MKKLSKKAAFFWILFPTLLISGTSYFIYFKQRYEKTAYQPILAILQTGSKKEALKTAYLAEILGLSSDQPVNLHYFNIKEGEKKLLACPLIESVKLKKIFPSTLYIDYTVYEPMFLVSDFENVAIDHNGYLFPITPFLTPKKLPEVCLGFKEFPGWKRPIQNQGFELAKTLLTLLSMNADFNVNSIDVSKAFAPRYGKREIILKIEDLLYDNQNHKNSLFLFPMILRLFPKGYEKQIGNFLNLRKNMLEDYRKQIEFCKNKTSKVRFCEKIIDLRIGDLAFINKS